MVTLSKCVGCPTNAAVMVRACVRTVTCVTPAAGAHGDAAGAAVAGAALGGPSVPCPGNTDALSPQGWGDG